MQSGKVIEINTFLAAPDKHHLTKWLAQWYEQISE